MKFIKEIFTPTVAGAMAQFQKSAAKLERVMAHHKDKAIRHDKAAVKAQFARDVAKAEAAYAEGLREKFSSIFGI